MKSLLVATQALVAQALVALPALAADPLPRAAPDALGLSPERLARIGTTIEAELREGRMPGAVIAIASMTKVLTGATLVSVLEEGRLPLNDPVSRFFPALGSMRVAVDGNPENTVPAARPPGRSG